MTPPTSHFPLFLLFLLLPSPSPSPSPSAAHAKDLKTAPSPFVGVTIGTAVTNLLSPSDLATFLQSQQITHVRLYSPDLPLLSALNSTDGISVILGVPTNQLLALASSPSSALSWAARHLLPFRPSLFSAIAAGDSVPSLSPSLLPSLLPALRSLSSSLASLNLSIPLSTPLAFSLLLDPFPPSQSFFNQSLTPSFVLPLLRFLSQTSSPLMLNLYPYYSFMKSHGVIPLANTLFKPIPPALEMVDPNTLLHYTNVYDAMVDAAHFAMRNLNFTDIPVLVTETGWPSDGDPKLEPFATKGNADTYNSNLIQHVLGRSGTPLHPEVTSSVYVYELFNEDLRPGPVSERNWGLFYGNGTPVYLLNVEEAGGFLANDTTNRTFCVVAEGADGRSVQAALDWACGPGRANCSEIQPGEDCYEPNTVEGHASYAFDSYYQMEGRAAGSCYFQGVAMVTTTDPSHGDCIFPVSKQISNTINAGGINATQSSSAEVITCWWRPRKRSELGPYSFPLILSLVVVIMTSGCTLWT